jgi:hypothetical protein
MRGPLCWTWSPGREEGVSEKELLAADGREVMSPTRLVFTASEVKSRLTMAALRLSTFRCLACPRSGAILHRADQSHSL